MSVDPLIKKFHSQSSYNYVANSPLIFADFEGKQKEQRIIMRTEKGDVILAKKIVDKDEVEMSIQKTSSGDALYSMDITEDLILDVRKGKEGVYSITSTSIRNSGFAAIADQYNDMFGEHEDEETKEFGFVNSGGEVGSDWVLKLPKAKVKENLDMSSILSAASKFGPESKGIFEKFTDIMSELKVGKNFVNEMLGVLAKTMIKQTEMIERGKDMAEAGKREITIHRYKKVRGAVCSIHPLDTFPVKDTDEHAGIITIIPPKK